ncbi:porin family protein [Spirosoma pollinicola]|uniref:Outer membrane protein beta-barrel domain-containing protein n=1 Tax=Spirosoma pollinicola TaxID=2057025 RepID=A0A2K8Z2P6_9BACT|nr:porin family protein [Spirosoma pollinicola]AUD04150.1 hypothetical protein CWM47_21320 [Spirosoma pollinicola]
MKTSKRVLILCWLLVFPGRSYGQSVNSFRYGITGGLNAGQLNTPSINKTSGLRWQYAAGVTVEQPFSSNFALAAELKYARHGAKAKVSGIMGNDAIISEYDYVTLPIFVRFQPKFDRIFIELGGQIGYFLAGRSYFSSKKDQALAAQNINRLDAGLTGGVGYRLGTHLVMDVRYYHSLRSLYEDFTAIDPITGTSTFIKLTPQYQRVWSLNLSYFFK